MNVSFNPIFSDSGGTFNPIYPSGAFVSVPLQGVQLALRLGPSLVWGAVPDTQNGIWIPVAGAQLPYWTPINDSQPGF